jgi:hypothetical protein
MATIKRYPTAQGERWEVRYRQPNGATSRKRGFATKRDASVWASKVETSKAEGAYVSPARGRMTVGDLSVGWLSRQEQTLSPSYYRTISYAYGKHVETQVGRRPGKQGGQPGREGVGRVHHPQRVKRHSGQPRGRHPGGHPR